MSDKKDSVSSLVEEMDEVELSLDQSAEKGATHEEEEAVEVPVYTMVQLIGLVLGPLLLGVTLLMPYLDEDLRLANPMLGITLWTVVWWLTAAVDLTIASLVPLVMIPFFQINVATAVAALYMNDVIFLYIGAFLVGYSFEKTHLHSRIALNILSRIGSNPQLILLAFMGVAWFLSMFCSNTATTALLVPFCLAVLEEGSEVEAPVRPDSELTTHDRKMINSRFTKGVLIGVAWGATSGGIATLIGTPPNAVLLAQYELNFGQDIAFGTWMSFGAPLSIIMVLSAWIILSIMFMPRKHQKEALNLNPEYFRIARDKLGAMSIDEIVVSCVEVAMITMWFSRPYTFATSVGRCSTFPFELTNEDDCEDADPENSWSAFTRDGTIAIMCASILFIVPSTTIAPVRTSDGIRPKIVKQRILNGDDIARLPWGIFLLFGAGFAINNGFSQSGLSRIIGEFLSVLLDYPDFVGIFLLVIFVCFITEFASNTATSTIMISIFSPVAVVGGVHPLQLLVPVTIASSLAFMFPIATPPNAVVFATGKLEFNDMAKAGFILNIVGSVLASAWFVSAGYAIFDIESDTLPDFACSNPKFCIIDENGTVVIQ